MTVPPNACRTTLTSSIPASAQLHRRWGPIGPLSDVAGGRLHSASDRTSTAAWASRALGRAPARTAAGTCRRLATGSTTALVRPRTARPSAPGSGGGCPLLRRARHRGRLHGVEHHGEKVGRRDPVDHAVVNLGDERPPLPRQTLDHPQLPERLAPIENLREDPPGEVAKLVASAGRRDRGVADVVQDLEVGIVDPDGSSDARRREADLLAVTRHERELGRDEADNLAVRRRGTLEHRNGPDVHRVGPVLDVEERRVLHAHRVHGVPSRRERGRRAPHGTQSAAQGTAASRSSGIGPPQATQRPYASASRRARASSISLTVS